MTAVSFESNGPGHTPTSAPTSPPTAEPRELVRELHGDRRVDGFAWLRDTADVAVLAHLRAEREYYDSATAHLGELTAALAGAMRSRLPPSDVSATHRRERYAYFSQTPEGAQYPQLRRVPQPSDDPTDDSPVESTLLLDPAELMRGSTYVDVGMSTAASRLVDGRRVLVRLTPV